MISKVKWTGEEDPLGRTEVVRKGLVAKIVK